MWMIGNEPENTEEAAPLPGADEFDERRRSEWKIGEAERRANSFLNVRNDPAEEAARNCLGMLNWIEQLHKAGRVNDEVWYRMAAMAREIDMLLGSV